MRQVTCEICGKPSPCDGVVWWTCNCHTPKGLIPEPVPKGDLTFALVKPDGYRRGLLVPVLQKAWEAGLAPVRFQELTLTLEDVVFLYGHVKEKYPEVWPDLVAFSMGGSCAAILFRGPGTDVVQRWRDVMGATRSWEAAPGTIRATWGSKTITRENVVHGSDSDRRALEEIRHFFGEEAARTS